MAYNESGQWFFYSLGEELRSALVTSTCLVEDEQQQLLEIFTSFVNLEWTDDQI